jgi:hypothetical protein
MNHSGAFVGAWVSVRDGCTIDYNVCGDQVEVVLGGRRGFEMVFTEDGLRTMVATGSQALAEMRAANGGDDQ